MIKEIIRPDHCIRICDECGDERKVSYWGVKNKTEHLCSSCSNKRAFDKKKDGYKPWNIGKTYQKASGNYYVNKQGYKLYYIGDKTYKGGYVAEHRIVMELHLGRRLKKGEVIHHIDGNKQNNDLSNLLLTNKSDHRNVHHQLESIAYLLIQSGLIKFNGSEYYIEPFTWERDSKPLEFLGSPNVIKDEGNQKRSLKNPLGDTPEERSTTIQRWSTLK